MSPDSNSPLAFQQFLGDVLRFAVIALVVVIPFRIFVAQPFIVSGDSMNPTFQTGEYLIVDQLSYRFESPARGDVIIFRSPTTDEKFFIKRIIGLPLETVSLQDGRVTIYNDLHPDGRQLDESYLKTPERNTSTTVSLGSEEYFVMGDNRPVSSDSRSWGPLEADRIQGRPILRLYPFQDLDLMPGLP